MAFANFSVLAFGSLLMGLPILLHLMMKQRPRHQIFPALRFLHRRRIANQRQLRLRHWILLAMRLVLVGLLAALLARPSVDSAGLGYWIKAFILAGLAPLAVAAAAYCWTEKKGLPLRGTTSVLSVALILAMAYQCFRAITFDSGSAIGDAQAPVAAVLVFDTSPRMGFQHENSTRLAEAVRLSRELIAQLPAESEVAVIDAAAGSTTFSLDKGTAINMVDSLQLAGSEFPLDDLVLSGIDLVQDRTDKRKEVYVLTDLSASVWQSSAFGTVRNRLAEKKEVSLFVVDVGVELPRNLQLGHLRLSAETLPKGRPLRIMTEISSLNVERDIALQVFLEKPDATRPVIVDGQVLLPESTRRDQATASLLPGATVPLVFELNGLPHGTHHGRVAIESDDGLLIDNQRFFTVQVRPAWPVLLATSEGATARFVEGAISPYEARQRNEAAFDCQIIDARDLISRELTDFAVVCLLDPSPLTPKHWQHLQRFVEQGGGLAVFLGRNADPHESFNQSAGAIAPGRLKLQWLPPKNDAFYVSVGVANHPVLSPFRGRESMIPWDDSPVLRHWFFADLRPDASVIARYSNDQPAIIESVMGRGRIITVTTPMSDAGNVPSRPAWNYIPTAQQPLPFFLLMQGMFAYLTDQDDQRWNHDVGQVVTLSVDDVNSTTSQLFTPEGDWQNVRSEDGQLTIASTDNAGTYRLKESQPNASATGFSTNLSVSATNLARLNTDQLDEVLGPDRYSLSRGIEALRRGVGRARVGRELYPFLILVVVGLVMMEYLMSNRFYVIRESTKNKLGKAA